MTSSEDLLNAQTAILPLNFACQDEWVIPYMVSGLAAVVAEMGEFERAATLIGAAEAMMEAEGAAWPPDERPRYERTLATLADVMDLAAFERARAIGRSMMSPGAVDFVLGTRSEA